APKDSGYRQGPCHRLDVGLRPLLPYSLQALGERITRGPSRGPGPARIDDHRWHLAGLRGPVPDAQLGARHPADLLDHFEHGQRGAGTDHHRPVPPFVAYSQPDSVDYVRCVHVIAHLTAVSVDLERPAEADGAHQPGDD